MHLSETVLIVAGLLGISVLAALVCRRIPLPFTALLVVIGVALSWLDHVWLLLEPMQGFRLSPDLVLYVFLPALIFESGYGLDGRQLMKDIVPVMALAVPALMISAGVIALGLTWFLGMDPTWALLFGALISATDPIAVIALFKELGAPVRLNVLVEGESLFNDATALVLFKVVLVMAVAGSLSWQQAGPAAGEFLYVFAGGVIVGLIFGFAGSWLLRFVRAESPVLALSIALAYASFVVSEHMLHLSGVVTVVTASLTFGTWGRSRMSLEVSDTLHDTWGFIAFVCNVLLFLLVGLSIDPTFITEHLSTIAIAVALVIAARAASVYSMVPLVTRTFGLHAISMREQHIMWWGGLKGGLAIAMALSIPDDVPVRDDLLALTIGVVLFTLLINAPTIRPLMQWLKMDRMNDDEAAELHAGLLKLQRHASKTLHAFREVGVISRGAERSVADDIRKTLAADEAAIGRRAKLRHIYMALQQRELETLDTLFKAGVTPQYTRMDIRNEIQNERDQLCSGTALSELVAGAARHGLFARFEARILTGLREIDWLSPLFMHYQYMRLSQRFRRDVARLMMIEAAQTMLREDPNVPDDIRHKLDEHLEQRHQLYRGSLAQLKEDMPEFYRHMSFRVATQASWFSALTENSTLLHHGQMGGKAYALIKRSIVDRLDHLPPVSSDPPEATVSEVLRGVPLFANLPEAVISGLIERATTLAFLPGDRVIGEGEHGDAMYIILHGTLIVHRGSGEKSEEMALLEDGDFFGEMALLGDQVRSVNVTALHACKLLRLKRDDVLDLAHDHPEIDQRLREVERQRREDSASSS